MVFPHQFFISANCNLQQIFTVVHHIAICLSLIRLCVAIAWGASLRWTWVCCCCLHVRFLPDLMWGLTRCACHVHGFLISCLLINYNENDEINALRINVLVFKSIKDWHRHTTRFSPIVAFFHIIATMTGEILEKYTSSTRSFKEQNEENEWNKHEGCWKYAHRWNDIRLSVTLQSIFVYPTAHLVSFLQWVVRIEKYTVFLGWAFVASILQAYDAITIGHRG